jgi:hypothetical protein
VLEKAPRMGAFLLLSAGNRSDSMYRGIMILALSVIAALSCGQSKRQIYTKGENLYAKVPEADRASLRTAIEKMIALRKASRWDLLFDIYDNKRNITKEQYILEEKNQPKLIEFSPTSVFYYPPGEVWVVHGCAVFNPMLHSNCSVFSELYARLTSDGWRLSEILIVVPKDTKATNPCADCKSREFSGTHK